MGYTLIKELSDFKPVNFEAAVRCTLSYILRNDETGEMTEAISLDGCMAVRDSAGQLHFNGPMTRTRFGKSCKIIHLSESLEHSLIAMIEANEKIHAMIGYRSEKSKDKAAALDSIPVPAEGLAELAPPLTEETPLQ